MLPDAWEGGSLRSGSSCSPLGMGEAVLCETKREGRRGVGPLGTRADLKALRCRVFQPPEYQPARLNIGQRLSIGQRLYISQQG